MSEEKRSQSEEVRAKLDERGIEYEETQTKNDGTTFLIDYCERCGDYLKRISVWSTYIEVEHRYASPKQAVDATVGRSCASCPEMDNPDSYISHLQSALKWHDEHVPRTTNHRNTCVVLQGERPPEEVLFVREDGSVTHYLPDGAGTCKLVDNDSGPDMHCTACGGGVDDEYRYFMDSWGYSRCPHCGARIIEEEAE